MTVKKIANVLEAPVNGVAYGRKDGKWDGLPTSTTDPHFVEDIDGDLVPI